MEPSRQEDDGYAALSDQLAASTARLAKAVEKNAEATSGRGTWGPVYTTVYWPMVDKFKISLNTFAVGDAIDKLSRHYAPVPGWCSASKRTLGRLTRQSERSAFAAVKELKEKGLVEEDGSTQGLLRTSELWGREVELCKRLN